MENLPKIGVLDHEEYTKYLELYFMNRAILNEKGNKVCLNCHSGNVEITEKTNSIILNCNQDSCYHWELRLPSYYNVYDSVEEIRLSNKSDKIKEKRIKKIQDAFDTVNDIDNKKRNLEQYLSNYRDLNIETSDPKNIAHSNLEIINLKKNIISILNHPKINFVPGSSSANIKPL